MVTREDVEAVALALAKANNHPEPQAYAAAAGRAFAGEVVWPAEVPVELPTLDPPEM